MAVFHRHRVVGQEGRTGEDAMRNAERDREDQSQLKQELLPHLQGSLSVVASW
jgi:hypothetical protein